jgi:SAM-dependent methyltransferase
VPPNPITGERVSSPEAGFNPTWQRHVAAYALAEPLLPRGRLLDLGCGVGHSYHLLAGRETVGVDIDAGALEGQDRETHVADMRDLPFPDGRFSSVLSVQSLEHVPDPERVVAEAARVVAPDGVVIFVTPNRLTLGRPDEIIDPYHHVEFEAGELESLCSRVFGSVEVIGLFGSERYMELFDEERRKLDRLLAKDPLRLRRLVPRRAKQALYDRLLRRNRAGADPRAGAIVPEDFELRRTGLEAALDLMAVCRQPR